MGHCLRRLGVIACLTVPSRVGAQLPPVGVPAGVIRVDLGGSLESFDDRFRDGHRESYAADLASGALGSDRIPALADADARIARIIGDAGYRTNLGALTAEAHADVGRGYLGLGLGLTNRITIFGRLPLVDARVQPRVGLNPAGANAGINPGAGAQAPFFSEFDAALATLSANIANGTYSGTQRDLAIATLAQGTALRTDLFGLLADPITASSFVPVASSPAGTAVETQVESLQNTLASDLGVSGFSSGPALPGEALTQSDLTTFFGTTLGLHLNDQRVTFRGDGEAGVALTLVNRWDRGTHRGGFRAALSGLARFPTGRRDRTDHPLDIGTGEGHTDLQLDLVADLGAGPLGARLTGTYVRQLPSDIPVRVTAPGQPFVGTDRLTFVRRDPGDVVAIGVKPFYRLARTFAIQAGLEHWSRTSDAVSYASPADEIVGLDPNVLSEETSASATVLSAGVTIANPGRLTRGGTGMPVDASWSYERVIQAGGGRVPDSHLMRGQLRLYFGLW